MIESFFFFFFLILFSIFSLDLLVSVDSRIVETIILAVSNLCTDMGLTQSQTLTVIHYAVFGETHKKPLLGDKLQLQDFVSTAKEADSAG